ncbi:unnamed protein product [Effrenium voratum]|nr:unnamed protein product [Effrenium voratum]
MAFPEALRCLKLTLPFSDVKELVASGVVCRDLCSATQQSELWEAFRATYTQDKWQTRRGTQVQPPEREDGESAKTYFERIYERYLFFKNQDAVICQRCGTWTSLEEEALECERCVDTWCDECAPRGPSKRSVPCKEEDEEEDEGDEAIARLDSVHASHTGFGLNTIDAGKRGGFTKQRQCSRATCSLEARVCSRARDSRHVTAT